MDTLISPFVYLIGSFSLICCIMSLLFQSGIVTKSSYDSVFSA